jgi:hypothetical protein
LFAIAEAFNLVPLSLKVLVVSGYMANIFKDSCVWMEPAKISWKRKDMKYNNKTKLQYKVKVDCKDVELRKKYSRWFIAHLFTIKGQSHEKVCEIMTEDGRMDLN